MEDQGGSRPGLARGRTPRTAPALGGAWLLAATPGAVVAFALIASAAMAAERPPTALAIPSTHAAGAPAGYTGGFGEPTCQSCHSEYAVNLDGRLVVEGLPKQWEPGRSYTLTLVLESEGMERAGFQAAIRWADGGDGAGTSAGELRPVDDRVATVPTGPENVAYVGHAPDGLPTEPGTPASWTLEWVAPEGSCDGDVVFHAAANSANGDDSPFGDIVYTVSDTVGGPGD